MFIYICISIYSGNELSLYVFLVFCRNVFCRINVFCRNVFCCIDCVDCWDNDVYDGDNDVYDGDNDVYDGDNDVYDGGT